MEKEKVYDINGVQVEVVLKDNGTVLFCMVKGNLETANSPVFLETLEKELNNSVIKKVILDLKGLAYVSSTGIGSFTSLLINCKNKGAELILKNMDSKVKSIFDILGFTSFFTME